MNIDVSLMALTINERSFDRGVPLQQFESALGPPDRVDDGPVPAPVGHRNNQIWFWDNLGIFANEHHSSRLIQGVGVVIDLDHAYRKPLKSYSGTILVCGVPIETGMEPQTLLENCSVDFRWHLGHSLVYDAERLSIDIDTFSLLTKSGRKSKRRQICVVSVGFRNAHLSQESPTSNL
jgi:hypothetical protein